MTTSRELYVDGHKLVAICRNEASEGLPSILLHGITASPYYWTEHLTAPFAALGPCYALTLLGHYPARFPEGLDVPSLTAELIADVLSGAIKALVGDRPVQLVGHSTGGFSALAAAALGHVDVRQVISIAGFAQGQWIGKLGAYQRYVRSGRMGKFYFKTLYTIARLDLRIFKAAMKMYAADPEKMFAHPDFDALLRATFPAYRRLDLESMAVYFAAMPDIDISPHLDRIQVPTLVMTGDRDTTVPPAQARLISERIPHADLIVIPGAGHLPSYENGEAYRQALEAWLVKATG